MKHSDDVGHQRDTLPIIPEEFREADDRGARAVAVWTGRRFVDVVMIALLLLAIVYAGVWGGMQQERFRQAMTAREAMVVYFGTEDADGLIGERHFVTAERRTPEEALAALLAGPRSADLISTIPAGTRLLGLRVEDGIAWADFSSELQDLHGGGSAGELLTIYAIVATLTEFDQIDRVGITIEGRRIESLAGHLDLLEPIVLEGPFILDVRSAP